MLVGECAAKVQILENKLNEDDGQLALDYNSPGARRRRIKARAVRRGVQQSGDSSDYAMSPTKQLVTTGHCIESKTSFRH